MNYFRYRLAAIGLALVAASPSASLAGEYIDSSGFSLNYPAAWTVVSKQGDLWERTPQETKNWIAKNKIDLSKVSMVLLGPSHGDFRENLNVVVAQEGIPVNDEAIAEMTGSVKQHYEAMGLRLEKFDGHIGEVGAGKAIVLNYETRLPAAALVVRQQQVYLPLGNKTYIITSSAKASTFDAYLPVFESVVMSFRAPAGPNHDVKVTTPDGAATALDSVAFAREHLVTLGVIVGAVCGMIAALVAAVKSMGARESVRL